MESKPSTSTYTSTTQWLQPCRKFEMHEILLATGNFNESLVIGRGGFGKVYEGEVIVGTSHVAAALKRLDLMSDQGAAEFWAEVDMLSQLRHSHIVSLIGYCNYEREMILVYEYMPNRTLEDHLYKLRTRGLDYLHTGTGIEFGVIHRDVKSSNILLHQNWAAKISDFGLSRIGPANQPRTYVNTLVKGTFGYLDPNYFATGELTRKSDVYAFGVVLFEVLCQKRPLDRSLECGLATWAQDSIKEVQTPAKSIFTRMVDVLPPFHYTGENPGMGFGFLTAKKRKKFLLQNGALLLDKLKNFGAGSMEIFSAKTIEVATQNYADDIISGRGGSGTVFKGILPDNHVIAIKKSEISDSGQLLGCCLETKIPLLAYEYVCNGNLYEHFHTTGSVRRRLSWDTHVSIAYDTASALAYLHTNTVMSIIHRDVKSSNIFLDNNLTAKIADCVPRLIPPDDPDDLHTFVQGTLGYLDPEYCHTCNISDKSDVYSFGVVLVEVLTGNKPLDFNRAPEERNLASYFTKLKKENRLHEIVDHQVLKEAADEQQLKAASDLACRCLDLKGENRPIMKEVAMELETIRKLAEQHPFVRDNHMEPCGLVVEASEQADLGIFENYSDSNFSDIFRNNEIYYNAVYSR
uniref:wall-associated receptor kinase-like 10 n=1 Tax=Erigeron canadensis TaxID=72917 RepID=UPI001CB9C1AB|nr:wall-associated receptor kinase-like 10 [Erigeron canadensis]